MTDGQHLSDPIMVLLVSSDRYVTLKVAKTRKGSDDFDIIYGSEPLGSESCSHLSVFYLIKNRYLGPIDHFSFKTSVFPNHKNAFAEIGLIRGSVTVVSFGRPLFGF